MITRFAPSPTGRLHLGNLRTALFNALLAYQAQGSFLLRIEDTDVQRSQFSFSEWIQEDLKWLGLDWTYFTEKTPVVFQSQRREIYFEYYQKLLNHGHAYPCFCSESELKQMRDHQRKHHQAPVYSGICRNLSKEDVARKKAQGLPYNLRFKIPSGRTIVFEDLIKGKQTFKSNVLSDFIIQRSDQHPTFLYCNALDDALMNVTHVLRGEDHVSNTPKQVLLLEALNLNVPKYGHLPLIISQNSDMPLSKRDNSFHLETLQNKGYFPLALLNYLARLGHTVSENNLMTFKELAGCFKLDKIHQSSARFDEGQLNFWQKQAMHAQNVEALWNHADQTLIQSVSTPLRDRFLSVVQPMIVFPSEMTMWASILLTDGLEYSQEAKAMLRTISPQFWKGIIETLQSQDLEAIDLKQYIRGFEKAKVKLHWSAVRYGLTGRSQGPELIKIMDILGKKRILKRLQQALFLSSL